MSVEFEEIRGFDYGDVQEVVINAIELATGDGVPEDLRVAVFQEAARMFSQRVKVPKIPAALRGLVVPPNG